MRCSISRAFKVVIYTLKPVYVYIHTEGDAICSISRAFKVVIRARASEFAYIRTYQHTYVHTNIHISGEVGETVCVRKEDKKELYRGREARKSCRLMVEAMWAALPH